MHNPRRKDVSHKGLRARYRLKRGQPNRRGRRQGTSHASVRLQVSKREHPHRLPEATSGGSRGLAAGGLTGSPGYMVRPLHPSSHICKARDSGHCFINVLKGQVSDLPDFDACAPGKMDTGTKATIFALFQGVARPQADHPRISSKGSEVLA